MDSFADEFPADAKRIVAVLRKRGIIMSREEAAAAWERYSNSVDGGWICLPSDDTILYELIYDFIEGEGD